jgi:hypothetical protein
MYTALQIVRTPTGQFFTEYDRQGQLVRKEWYAISWKPLGPCASMEDARQRYGGRPVLEEAK